MSTTTVGPLLKIWSLRLKMQEEGTTKPSASARQVIKSLVEKLSQLDCSEEIDVRGASDGNPLATFTRVSTGEILAEIFSDESLTVRDSNT